MCLCNTMPPMVTKPKKLFSASMSKSSSHGYRPGLGVIWKGVISTCMCRHIYAWNIVNCDVKQPIKLKLKTYCSKVIAKVKVDSGQTNKQTDGTKTVCPRSFDPGHKNGQWFQGFILTVAGSIAPCDQGVFVLKHFVCILVNLNSMILF